MVEDNSTLPDTGIVVITITNKRSQVMNFFNGFTVGIGFTTYKACAKQYEAFSQELKHDLDKITRAIGDTYTIGVKFFNF